MTKIIFIPARKWGAKAPTPSPRYPQCMFCNKKTFTTIFFPPSLLLQQQRFSIWCFFSLTIPQCNPGVVLIKRSNEHSTGCIKKKFQLETIR